MPCIFGMQYPFVPSSLGKSSCNHLSTFAMSGLELFTSSLSLQLWNHSSIDKYSLINFNHLCHLALLYPKPFCNFLLPWVIFAIHNSRNRLSFLSSDRNFVPSMRPFLMAPQGKSQSLWFLTVIYNLTCSLSILSWSFPDPSWALSDSNMYLIRPLPDVCNNSGGIILYGPWQLFDRGIYLSVRALLISYHDISFKFVSPSLLFSLFNLFTAHISSIVVSTHVGFGFDISEKSHWQSR